MLITEHCSAPSQWPKSADWLWKQPLLPPRLRRLQAAGISLTRRRACSPPHVPLSRSAGPNATVAVRMGRPKLTYARRPGPSEPA